MEENEEVEEQLEEGFEEVVVLIICDNWMICDKCKRFKALVEKLEKGSIYTLSEPEAIKFIEEAKFDKPEDRAYIQEVGFHPLLIIYGEAHPNFTRKLPAEDVLRGWILERYGEEV